MDFLNKKATFIINNSLFVDKNSFREEFVNSESCKEVSSGFVEQNVKVRFHGSFPTNMPLPECPIIVFTKNNCQIVYDDLNKTIEVTTTNYDTDKILVKELLNVLCQFKLQDIDCVRIIFSSQCDNGSNRLNIFNACIDTKLSNWNCNIGFNVRIPIQEQDKDYSEDYRVSKVRGSQKENYVYNVDSIFEFKIILDKANLRERLKKLEAISYSIDELNDKFEKTCKEIMSL